MLGLLIRRSLKRDFRLASLRILLTALIVAVAAVSAVGFFTDRVSRAMKQQAGNLLAADLRVVAARQLPAEVNEKAIELGLQTATVTSFPSVVLNDDDESQLVAVKAVSQNYPLRGKLVSTSFKHPEKEEINVIPPPGSVSVDPVLIELLTLTSGSQLLVGNSELTVESLVEQEPDRGGDLFQMAPRLLMNAADLDRAGLLIDGSRARYALLISGNDQQIERYRQWFNSINRPGIELRDANNARPQIQRVLDQISKFFGLAAMVAVLLAGAAIAMSVRQYALDQASAGAVLRTLGASRKTVLLWMLVRLVVLATIALAAGLALGLLAQTVLASLLGNWFELELPAAGWRPVGSAVVVTILTLIGFASLPLLRAGSVPVLSVLRRELGNLGISARLTFLFAILSGIAMMYMQSGDMSLVLILLAGLVAILAVLALAGGFLYRAMRLLTPASWSITRLVLRRRMDVTLLQLSTFGMAIMAMLLVSVVRDDILQAWQQDIPDTAPDHFIVNIQPAQVESVLEILRKLAGFKGDLYPVSRGRLTAVNGQDAELRYAGQDEAQGMLQHEFNLSFSDHPPRHNTLSEGSWWRAGTDELLISAESGFCERLNLKLGDQLTFQVAGVERTARISNIREVEWESFQVNFFAITSSVVLDDLPAMYITSFRQPEHQENLQTELVRENPGITVIDVGTMLERVRGIIAQGALAVQSVFLFTLLAGIIVLLSAIQSSQASRTRELAVLRSMGASHRQVRQSVFLEFTLLGACSGFLAAFFANAVAWVIGYQILDIPISGNPMLWVYGTVGGALVIGTAGYMANRKVMYVPPLTALRASA